MGIVCKKFISSSTDRRGPTSIPGSLSFTDVFRWKNHDITSGARPCCPSPRLAMYGLSSSPKGAVFLSGFLYSTLIYVLFRNQKCDLSEILNYFFTFIFFLPSKNLQVTQNQEKNYKMIVRM